MTNVTAAGTYVQVSREELEQWLDSIGFHGKWERDGRTAGVYILKVGPAVAVKLYSTIGSDDDAKGRGKSSMQLSLVSTVTGKTLNRKAQGQDHFKRTIGWRKTWAAGIETMKNAYLSSTDFYDAIAVIADRDAYRTDVLKDIETIPGWDNETDLIRLYRKVENGGVLVAHELEIITEAKRRPVPKTPDPQRIQPSRLPGEGVTHSSPDQAKEAKVQALRQLWFLAKRSNDEWTMNFAEDIAKKWIREDRRLTGPQLRLIGEKLSQYGVKGPNGAPAYQLF
jgi:hypothetical protein